MSTTMLEGCGTIIVGIGIAKVVLEDGMAVEVCAMLVTLAGLAGLPISIVSVAPGVVFLVVSWTDDISPSVFGSTATHGSIIVGGVGVAEFETAAVLGAIVVVPTGSRPVDGVFVNIGLSIVSLILTARPLST